MKALFVSIGLLLALVFSGTAAMAHPGHGRVEHVTSFTQNGVELHVWNTHRRGLFGAELIEIRDRYMRLYAAWWASPGWCFSERAYDDRACYSENGYLSLFKTRIKSHANRNSGVGPFGSNSGGVATGEFCDYYSQLEYTVSGDTSGICGHQDGLPLPAWAQ